MSAGPRGRRGAPPLIYPRTPHVTAGSTPTSNGAAWIPARSARARYGLGRERVTQIVRQRARQDPGPEPDPRPDDALPASELDAWWVERADAVGAYYDLNGHLPYTPHPDPDIDALAWWLHQQAQGARTVATTRRERYRRAYLERVAPTWDPTAYPQARPDRTTSSSTP